MHHPSYPWNLKLLDTFAKKGGLDIIDYGCGNGTLLDILDPRRVKSYKGYEVSRPALEVAKQLHPGKKFSFSYIRKNFPPKLGKANSVDLVILIGVLQYLTPAEMEKVIHESSRVLRKGGLFLASCVTDHQIYQQLNMYRFFFPNNYINHQQLVKLLEKSKLKVVHHQEKGLLIGPLFSHGLVILFDAIDKVAFRNQGKLGPIGIAVRKLFQPVMSWEYQLNINYGYTLFVVGKK